MEVPRVEYYRSNFVSLWVGQFPGPDDADAYFAEEFGGGRWTPSLFSAELGLGYYPPWKLEFNFEQTAQRPLRQLLQDVTFSASFLDRALETADRLGVREAQGVVLLYDFDYRAKPGWAEAVGPVRFVGTFASVRTAPSAKLQPYYEVAERIGYSAGAVLFVALQLGNHCKMKREEQRTNVGHVSARVFCDHLLRCHDYAAILREYRLSRSEDVGRVIFGLVNAGLVRSQQSDSEADFQGLFVLE